MQLNYNVSIEINILFQLIDDENIKAVVSMNEDYELSLLSNTQKVM